MTMRNTLLVGSAALLRGVAALNHIVVQGQDFADSVTGDRFEIVGVDYQPGGEQAYDPTSGVDVLSTPDACLRDAALLQRLGANTIRTYNLNPDLNHDECASIFNAAGIYLIIDVNVPQESINRADPSSSYNVGYLNRTFGIIDNFRSYDNTLAFFSSNELVNDDQTSKEDPPYIRAVTRDLKQYLAARGGRAIPIGYSAADVRNILVDTTNYISCHVDGEDNDISRSDFIGVNGYSWCGPTSNFVTGQYSELAEFYADTTIPVFFSEYGCNKPQPRYWNEVLSIYSTKDMPTFSGGLAYEWTQEANDYGLVQLNDNNTLSLLRDYNVLQSQLKKVDFGAITTRNETAVNLKPPTCSADIITSGAFDSEFNIPDQPDGVADLIKNGKGGIQGKLVDVGDLTVHTAVYNVDGSQVKNLAVSRVSGANTPSSATSTAAAASNGPVGGMAMGGIFGMLIWLLG